MDTKSLLPIQKVASILGILPPLTQTTPITNYIKIFTYISLFITSKLYENYESSKHLHKVQPTIIWITAITDLTVSTLNILAILLINLRHGKKITKFIKTLQRLEYFMVNKNKVMKQRRIRFYKFLASNMMMLCFIGFGISIVGIDMYLYFILKDIQTYHVFITTIVIVDYCGMIGKRMNDLNQQLVIVVDKQLNPHGGIKKETSELVSRLKTIELLPNLRQSYFDHNIDVMIISKAYTTISELVDCFNIVFGPLFVLFSMNIVVNILGPLNMALLYSRNIPIFADMEFGIAFLVFCLLWMLFPIYCGVSLFFTCGRVEKEMGIVPNVCYMLMKRLGSNDLKLRDDLERYANQADRLKPKFTASGFFEINFALILPILGSAVTYIMVLMQFHTMTDLN